MFGWKIRIVRADQVVISRAEYQKLQTDSDNLKKVYQRIAKAINNAKQRHKS